jgi:hypothetical protein
LQSYLSQIRLKDLAVTPAAIAATVTAVATTAAATLAATVTTVAATATAAITAAAATAVGTTEVAIIAAAATATTIGTATAATAVATTTTAAAVATTAFTRRTLLSRARFIDHHSAATEVLAMHTSNGRLRLRVISHFHKTKSFGATCVALHHHASTFDFTKRCKSGLQIIITHRVRQIAYIQSITHLVLPINV